MAIISDNTTFVADTRLQAQYEISAPPEVSAGNISVPLSSSGSYAYWNCNVNLGSLTIKKVEINRSSPYGTWRITCTGSGTWTGSIQWQAGFFGGGTGDFTLNSGTQTVTISSGMEIDGNDGLGTALITGSFAGNVVSSVSLTFVTN